MISRDIYKSYVRWRTREGWAHNKYRKVLSSLLRFSFVLKPRNDVPNDTLHVSVLLLRLRVSTATPADTEARPQTHEGFLVLLEGGVE